MPELKFTEEQACVTAPHSLRPASLAPPPAFRLPVPPERDVAQRGADFAQGLNTDRSRLSGVFWRFYRVSGVFRRFHRVSGVFRRFI